MDAQAQQILLDVARAAINSATQGGPGQSASVKDQPPPELQQARGAFVTLHDQGGELRGCMGTTQPRDPLIQVVAKMAAAAALQDPRFPPVRPEEVETLGLEVSVLSPPEPLDDLKSVKIGTHGLVAEGRGRRGLLLPQVASERDWDVQTFVSHTCLKAGLPQNAWQDEDVDLFCFRSEVFSETQDLSA